MLGSCLRMLRFKEDNGITEIRWKIIFIMSKSMAKNDHAAAASAAGENIYHHFPRILALLVSIFFFPGVSSSTHFQALRWLSVQQVFCGDVDRYSQILISVVYLVISTPDQTAAAENFFHSLEIWHVVAKGDNELVFNHFQPTTTTAPIPKAFFYYRYALFFNVSSNPNKCHLIKLYGPKFYEHDFMLSLILLKLLEKHSSWLERLLKSLKWVPLLCRVSNATTSKGWRWRMPFDSV